MVSIIICGHSHFAEGLLSAAEMVFGEQDNIAAVTFEPQEGIQDLSHKYGNAINHLDEKENVLFLTDIFGGSPYNSAAQFVSGQSGMNVVAGISLPALLEILGIRDGKCMNDILDTIKESYASNLHIFSVERENMARDDMDDL